jgi:hypothetical protein
MRESRLHECPIIINFVICYSNENLNLDYRKTPYLVPGTTLVLLIIFSKLVPGTKCSQKIFQKFFRSNNKVFGPVQIPQKKLF